MHTAPATLLTLAEDVLAQILSTLPTPALLSIARTCSALRAAALPALFHTVSLGGHFHTTVPAPHRFRAFCASALEGPAQLAHLRRLFVKRDAVRVRTPGGWANDPECTALLSAVLARPQARGLAEITLWGADALFSRSPALIDVLSTLPNLCTVTLGGALPPLRDIVRAFPHARAVYLIDGPSSGWLSEGIPDPEDADAPQWASLDTLETTSVPAMLTTRIRRLALRFSVSSWRAADALALIARTQPSVFECAVDAALPDADFLERLPDVAQSVRYLDIAVHAGTEDDVSAFITRAAPHVAKVPLRALTIHRHTARPPPSGASSPGISPLPSRVASRVASRVPSPSPAGPSSRGPQPFLTSPPIPSLLYAPRPLYASELPLPPHVPEPEQDPLEELARTLLAAARAADKYAPLGLVGVQTAGGPLAEGQPLAWFTPAARALRRVGEEDARVRALAGLDRWD